MGESEVLLCPYRYLDGFIFDENLTFSDQISSLSKRWV